MPTVVTGASGFIGGVLVRALLAEGREVRAVDLVRGPTLDSLDVEFIEADVLDAPSLKTALDGADVVYHLAAVISVTGDPTGRVRAINVDGTRDVAEQALKAEVRRFVHCISVHAFDLEAGGVINENSIKATEPDLPVYDRSKAAGEDALREVIGWGLDAVIVNPTGVIGPYDYVPSRMGQVFLALFQGRMPALIDGAFDWVDVRDVASSMIAAESKGRTGKNYLLPGDNQSIARLAELAEEVSGVPAPRFTAPMWLVNLLAPVATVMSRRTGSALWSTTEALHALANSPPISGDRAQTELGHHPRPIDITVDDIYRWLTEQGLLGEPS